MKNIKLISVLGLSSLLACSSAEVTSAPEQKNSNSELSSSKSTRSPRAAMLTREAALIRFKQISKVSYRLWFGLDSTQPQFLGRTSVQFDLKPKSKDFGKKIFLDFEGGTLNSVVVNGNSLQDLKDPQRYNGYKLYFDLNELNPTGNRIEISFTHPYSTDGNGLHRFKDPADQLVYLYSDFEPYRAHRMFPCFDQPDLKASYELTVEAPPEWQVISNTLEKETRPVDGRKSWIFPTSPVFSTYVFALHAGPYSVWKGNADGIPTRLFSRKSLAKYVDHQEWLKITKQGLEFFGTEFGIPYPFSKYDQIIVPDFNAGAMENVGAVTFSERTVYRTAVTQDRHRRRADTILHEMAHMWFGDLVTMRWWNGLWLNESFATLSAATAVDKATDFGGSWQAFFSDMKKWAYWEDQLVTTHPIELPVPDTDSAEANFDGITYGKGASTLKQLRFYLGEDDFREGLQRYFQNYAYRNTTLSDFMKMLEEASSEDLNKWQKTWLQTAGVNTLRTDWKCETNPDTGKSTLSQFDLIQLPANSSNEIRPHRTQVALYYFQSGKNRSTAPLVPSHLTEIAYSTPSTPVRELMKKPCPDFVFPNVGDYDYVKVELDPVSLKQSYQSLARISDPLTRQMIWHTLWEMVVDGKIRAQDFANTALTQGKNEKDTLVLSAFLTPLASSSAEINSVLKFLTGDLRTSYQKKIEPWIKHHLLLAPAKSDQQLVWYHALVNVASQPDTLQFLHNLLNGRQKLQGFTVDQEHRWEIIKALARNGVKEASELIAQDLKKDLTDMGEKAAIGAEVLIPDPTVKSRWLDQVTLKEGKLPLAKLREAMSNYHQIGQEAFTLASVETYFETLPTLALSENPQTVEYSKWFADQMYPSLCDPKIIEKTNSLLKDHPEMPASVIKDLKIRRQEEERCIRARAKSQDPETK